MSRDHFIFALLALGTVCLASGFYMFSVRLGLIALGGTMLLTAWKWMKL